MSASLVGSEMCIRDSSSLLDAITVAVAARLTLAYFRDSATAAAAGDVPVSYTHLTLPTICSV
eukprot:14439558-Alexandrium_andersonii.AAC.1